MEILFMMTLPGLVLLIIAAGVFQLVRAKISGKKRPSSATSGIDMLDLVLKPGSEHRIEEIERNKTRVQESGDEAPPLKDFKVGEKTVKSRK